ncbi:hypothetical protein GCM10017687_30220 [Streptomyces echinatus]
MRHCGRPPGRAERHNDTCAVAQELTAAIDAEETSHGYALQDVHDAYRTPHSLEIDVTVHV